MNKAVQRGSLKSVISSLLLQLSFSIKHDAWTITDMFVLCQLSSSDMLQLIATNRRISLTDLNGAVQYCTAAIHTNKHNHAFKRVSNH